MINNTFYDEMGEAWYQATNHPVALLRSENRARIPWIQTELRCHFQEKISFLDIGCGAGLLTNALAKEGHQVTGIDLSPKSLEIAKKYDETKGVSYLLADAYSLPFEEGAFDVAAALDVLEHVEEPWRLLREASRILKPGGVFFFHTFNRNFLSYLLVIKGVEWFVRNTPKDMHVYPLFIKPKELVILCREEGLFVQKMKGLQPRLFTNALLKLVLSGKVPEDFSFRFTKSCRIGYCGIAKKEKSYG